MTANTDVPDGSGEAGQSVQLSVPEMDCPSCAGKVDKSLGRVDGVLETTLQPTTGTATVRYDPDRSTRGDVVGAIEAAGYEVTNDGADGANGGVDVAPPTEVWTSPRALRTWVGAAVVTLGLVLEFPLAGSNPEVASVLGYQITLAGVLFLAAVAVSGLPVVRNGYYSARNLSLDIDLLTGTAILAATGIGYFVEAATLAVLFSVAELLEEYAMDRARDSLRELMELSPDEATVERDGEEVTVPAEEVAIGETVVVRPGGKIPLDGTVIDGESAVDESPITGESVPVDKTSGDEVYAGAINEEGYLEVEVTSLASDSTLSRIIEMVQGAQAKQTETEQFVDRFAGGWEIWFIRGLTLLVIACPCAFVISTPVSVVSGITSAAKNGVLIKGGNHLEAMGEVDAVAVDKTGTLTRGELSVTDVVPAGETSERDLLRYAAAIERRSEHPVADAILARATAEGIADHPDPDEFESLTGKGVRGEVDGRTHYAGKPALFEELGFDLSAVRGRADGGAVAEESAPDAFGDTLAALERDGKTVVLVGTATELLGAVAIADEVRPASKRAVQRLQELGVGRVVMLTGDNEGTARAIAEQVGVDEYRAELLPEEKVDAIESLQAEYGDVAMVGDGIGKLPYLYSLSNTANGVIRQNIWASLGVKALLAVGVPLGYVSVALAVVVGDMGMSLGVTGNALRLSRLRPD